MRRKVTALDLHLDWCSYLLFSWPGRCGVKDMSVIQRLSERMEASLKVEINKTRLDEESFLTALVERLPKLRQLSAQHIIVLNRFKQANPSVEFPALHKELFSPDGLESA